MAGKYKTLTLVEEAELDRLRQRQLKDYNPGLKSMVSIQDQIENILKDPQLDDDSKYKILTSLQEKFGYLYNKFKNSALPPPQLEVVNAAPANAPNQDGDRDAGIDVDDKEQFFDSRLNEEEDIFSDVQLPYQYSDKFKKFKEFLVENRGTISKNHKNELVLDGVPFPNSCMPDLLRSFYVRNVSMNLIGLPNLLQKLHSLNVNHKLFSHKDATNSLNQLKRLSTDSLSKTQKGKGKSFPPGKKPRLLHVFRL